MGHLTPKDEKRIIKLIEEWSEPKLTWPLLVEACKEKLGISRARQSLMNLTDTDWRLFKQAGHAQSSGLLGTRPGSRLRDEQIYRPFRRERQIWRGQPSKGPIKIAIVEL